jgi:hypothetical protein
MDMIEILMVLEENTGFVIPDAELTAVETVADLAACEPAVSQRIMSEGAPPTPPASSS